MASELPSLYQIEALPEPSRSRPRRGAPLLEAAEAGDAVALHEAAQARYLNYALSVITSRALPDVRDGLKPVQRRILYTMWRQRLTADAKPRKCAKVVGDVMGSYHPHGDTAIYDTLVRMAQPFALRYPLIEGFGNFGSLDGDGAAAMRYTECRLAAASAELLAELDRQTVAFRANYDGTRDEPVVLPARLPNLLINGATGIAVGMATNMPPHHAGEVCAALLALLDAPQLDNADLCRHVRGPDFPTGGHVLNTPEEIESIYRTGAGAIRLRATWEEGPRARNSKTVHVTSVPYATNKAQIVERIAELALARKLPPLLDVKDQSTDDVRIVLELKADADVRMVMAYLFRHTPLQTSFAVNLTCLTPAGDQEVCRPERVDLKTILRHFLDFRLDVVTRRLQHELAALRKRIHILEGFEQVFDALDAIIRLIRQSDGKADAARRIMARFALDAEQTDAILELKIYRLARLEILLIREELTAKRARATQIVGLLENDDRRWRMVGDEIREIRDAHGDPRSNPRRTRIAAVADDVQYSADDFIVDEDHVVLLSRDGWIKRQKEVRDVSSTRLREGDALLAALAGSTRATCVFFSNLGTAYTCRIADVPASTGYGEPIQRLFRLRDGERVVAAFSLDPRATPHVAPRPGAAEPPTHAVAVSSDGYALRFSLEPFAEPGTRAGRRFARPAQGAEMVGVAALRGAAVIIAVTRLARAILCAAREISFLSGPGKGVMLIKLDKSRDAVLGFTASTGSRELLTVETSRGALQNVSTARYDVTARGGKGRELLQRGRFTRVVSPPVATPVLRS